MTKLCIISTIPATIKAFFGKQLVFLQKKGFDITIISSPQDGDQNIGNQLPDGIKIETVAMSRTIKPFNDFKALLKISAIVKDGKFDIVQYVTPKAALLGSLASWRAKVPVRLYLMWGLYYVTQRGFRRFVFKCAERIVCACSTAIAPDSKGNVKVAIGEGLCKPEKIGVVGHGSANGVDTDRFDPDKLRDVGLCIRREHKLPDDAVVFGSIAAIVGDKGVNELIEAFDIIVKKYTNAYLFYIGKTAEKDPVKKTTLQTMNNHPQIINLGRQLEPEKYLAAMDIFVLPTYREGFGMVNIEASAMELPVISTDVPGPQESIIDGETGILVPAKTVQPLVDAMTKLIEDSVLAKRLGKAGRKRVLEFYGQKKLWNLIVEHKLSLLENAK